MKSARIVLAAVVAGAAMMALTATQAEGANKFAAIAVDKTTAAFGYGFNYSTRGAAEDRALSECQVRTPSPEECKGIVWVRNGCAAVTARKRENGSLSRIAWAIADRKAQAIERARNAGGPQTKLLVWVCTDRAMEKASGSGGGS